MTIVSGISRSLTILSGQYTKLGLDGNFVKKTENPDAMEHPESKVEKSHLISRKKKVARAEH